MKILLYLENFCSLVLVNVKWCWLSESKLSIIDGSHSQRVPDCRIINAKFIFGTVRTACIVNGGYILRNTLSLAGN